MYTHPTNIRQKPSLGNCAKHSSPEGENHEKDERKKHLFRLQTKAQKLLPLERMAKCLRWTIPGKDTVDCCFNPQTEAAHFAGLITCDSYSCPICAQKRAERDRRELSIAMAQAKEKGYFPLMLTFTLSHLVRDTLAETKTALGKAFDAVFSGEWAVNFKSEWGYVGKIKAWEFTYGGNGFHPHIHLLMFLDIELSGIWLEKFTSAIWERYEKALKKRGFHATKEHGLDVRTAESDIADYIAKFGREPVSKSWGADAEMAYSQKKKSSHDGLTPFELLAAADGEKEPLERLARARHIESLETAQKLAERLYIEFFNAMKRTPRIVWSNGLKRLLEIEEKLKAVEAADDEINQNTIVVVQIAAGNEWRKVIGNCYTADLRGELLELIRSNDLPRVKVWLYERGIAFKTPLIDVKIS